MGRRYASSSLSKLVLISVIAVLLEIEREDQEWEKSRKSKPKQDRGLESSDNPQKTEVLETKYVPKVPEKEDPKKKAPVGFY